MSDDLIKRLRQHRYNTWNDDLGPEPDKALAADCIEQLEKELNISRMASVVMDNTVEELEARIEELVKKRDYTEGTNDTLIALNQALEAKLAKAVDVLNAAKVYIDDLQSHEGAEGFSESTNQAAENYHAALAELE